MVAESVNSFPSIMLADKLVEVNSPENGSVCCEVGLSIPGPVLGIIVVVVILVKDGTDVGACPPVSESL